MGVSVEQWRAAIGSYNAGKSCSLTHSSYSSFSRVLILLSNLFSLLCSVATTSLQSVMKALMLLILLSGDVERNPGPDIMDHRPTILELTNFHSKTGFINISVEIGMRYFLVGIGLLNDNSGDILSAIVSESRGNIQHINIAILSRWVMGKGIADQTWRGLIGVLKVHCPALAADIVETLTDAVPPVLPLPSVLPLPQPSLNDCFRSAGLPVDCTILDKQIIGYQYIADIAKNLTHWRDLFPYFGLDSYKKEEIEAVDDISEQKRKLLTIWTHTYGPGATYRNLCAILWNQYRLDLVRGVCELVKSIMLQQAGSEETDCEIFPITGRSVDTRETANEHSRLITEEAMKVGRVKSKNYVILILGFAGAGKTHVLHLLLGEPPPPVRISTPLVQSPVRAITQSKARIAGKKWKRVRRNEQSRIVAENAHAIYSTSVRQVSKKPRISLMVENPLPLKTRVQSTPESAAEESVMEGRFLPVCHSDTFEEIAIMIEQCSGSHQALDSEVTLFNIIDSGGQPQFLEALPFFLPKRIIHVFVQKLNEHLQHFPKVELFGRSGTLIAAPYTSTLSNEQILKHCICSVQSSASIGSSPTLAIIGTHRELAERECPDETLADKNRRIAELLPWAVKDNAIKSGMDEFIIPVNAKNPSPKDAEAIAGLRQSIEDISIDEVLIPLQWYGLELAIQQLMEKFDRGILKVSEFEQETQALHLSPESVHEGLIYLDKLNIIHYYPQFLPGIVFCSSQILLDKITELVEDCYKLRGKVHEGAVNGPEMREFCQQGLVSRSRVSKLRSHYIPGIFEADDLLHLFSSLFLITKVSEDKYLMPCLLPVAEPLTPLVLQPSSDTSISPLLLYFPNGGVRLGIFCAFLSYLFTEAKWKLFESRNKPIHIFRNSVRFVIPGVDRCRITLSDSMSSYLHIAVQIPSRSDSNVGSIVCPTILRTLTSGLRAITDKMCYSNTDIEFQFAFFCPGQGVECCDSPHPSILHECGGLRSLLCCEDDMVDSCLGNKHKVWFADQAGVSASTHLQPGAKPNPSPPTPHQKAAPIPGQGADGGETAVDSHPSGVIFNTFRGLTRNASPLKLGNLGQVLRVLHDSKLAVKWKAIGHTLTVSSADLTGFDTTFRGDPSFCLLQMVASWLKSLSNPPSWWKLVWAIADPLGGATVHEGMRIAAMFCRGELSKFDPTSSLTNETSPTPLLNDFTGNPHIYDTVDKATRALSKELSAVAHQWIHVGVLLEVDFSWLERKRKERSDDQQRLHDMLDCWLQSHRNTTLQRLVEAVEHSAGGSNPALAADIYRKFARP